MLIKKKTTTIEEFDVVLQTPAYFKQKGTDIFYAVTEDKIMCIIGDSHTSIKTPKSYSWEMEINEAISKESITEAEFLAAYIIARTNTEYILPNQPKIQSTIEPDDRPDLKEWSNHIDREILASTKPDTSDFDRRVNQLVNNMNPML